MPRRFKPGVQAANRQAPHNRPEALDVALRYLATRPRSAQEIRRRLVRAGIDEGAVDATLRRLSDARLVDDAAFARYWLEQRRAFRPRGPRLLQAELRQHGVARELAAEAAEQAAASADQDAYRVAAARARRLAAQDERTFRSRLGMALSRRGFDWETIAPIVDRLWRETRAVAA